MSTNLLSVSDRDFIAQLTGNFTSKDVDEFDLGIFVDDEPCSRRELRHNLDKLRFDLDPKFSNVELVNQAYKDWINQNGGESWWERLCLGSQKAVKRVSRLSKLHPDVAEFFDLYHEREYEGLDGPSLKAQVAINSECFGERQGDHKLSDMVEQVDWRGYHVPYLRDKDGNVRVNQDGYKMFSIYVVWDDRPRIPFKNLDEIVDQLPWGERKGLLLRIRKAYMTRLRRRDESIRTVKNGRYWVYAWTRTFTWNDKDITFTVFSPMRLDDLREETADGIKKQISASRAFKKVMNDKTLGF